MDMAIIPWEMVLLCGLSVCVGWGIRGNFGHEYGAALAGALAAMAIALLSGREDWWRHVHYFALFGAIGWSFGGSMSYMMVVGYSHSSQALTVFYGFANLFAIGFLWAALGGAGTALPAFLTHSQLSLLFTPIAAVFIGWSLQAVIIDFVLAPKRMQRHESPLYWYDTDWVAALVAIVAALVVALFRGGLDMGTNLVLYMGIGWFGGFLLLVNICRLRMTPPRGDNWAGCVGMVIGILGYCSRYELSGVAFATLMTGFGGGIAFSFGQLLKLIYIWTGNKINWHTNWHSVMEQTQGFLFGLGIAIPFGLLLNKAPLLETGSNLPPWTEIFAVFSVLILLTYVNYRKAAGTWVDLVEGLPERFFGLPVVGWFRRSRGWIGWFELFYIGLGIACIWLLSVHFREPLAFIPTSWLGKGQLLYFAFIWWVVIFNFERALVGFSPHRLVTEGVITLNAIICTVLVVLGPLSVPKQTGSLFSFTDWVWQTLIWGTVVLVGTTVIFWGVKHLLFGKAHAPGASLHIRFGPDSNAPKAKPKAGEQHP